MDITYEQWIRDLGDARSYQRFIDWDMFTQLAKEQAATGHTIWAASSKRAANIIIPHADMTDVIHRKQRIDFRVLEMKKDSVFNDLEKML